MRNSTLLILMLVSLSLASLPKQGRRALQNEDYEAASVYFYQAERRAKGKAQCEAAYAHLLTLYADLGQHLLAAGQFSESSTIKNLFGGKVGDMVQIKVMAITGFPMISGIIDGMVYTLQQRYFAPALASAEIVVSKRCDITFKKGFPLVVSKNPRRVIFIGKTFSNELANFLAGFSGVALGLTELLGEVDLNATLSSIMEKVDIQGLLKADQKDFPDILRRTAIIFTENPHFLKFKEEKAYPFKAGALHLAKGLSYLSGALSEDPILQGKKSRGGDLLSWQDNNKDGRFSSGDAIRLHILKTKGPFPYKEWQGGEQFVNLTGGKKKSIFTPEMIQRVVPFLQRVARHLQKGEPKLLPLSQFNQLVPFPVKVFPKTIALNLREYLLSSSPPPLRSFLPEIRVEKATGFPVFAIEMEKRKRSANDFYFVTAPGAHFAPSMYQDRFQLRPDTAPLVLIPDDCIKPRKGESLIYSYVKDPSFGGLLRVDLSSLVHDNACKERDKREAYGGFDSAKDYPKPSLYAFNKAYNHWLRSFNKLIKLLPSFINKSSNTDH